ncbi:hypothetical protein D3C80_240780 [compost metagenome]
MGGGGLVVIDHQQPLSRRISLPGGTEGRVDGVTIALRRFHQRLTGHAALGEKGARDGETLLACAIIIDNDDGEGKIDLLGCERCERLFQAFRPAETWNAHHRFRHDLGHGNS